MLTFSWVNGTLVTTSMVWVLQCHAGMGKPANGGYFSGAIDYAFIMGLKANPPQRGTTSEWQNRFVPRLLGDFAYALRRLGDVSSSLHVKSAVHALPNAAAPRDVIPSYAVRWVPPNGHSLRSGLPCRCNF